MGSYVETKTNRIFDTKWKKKTPEAFIKTPIFFLLSKRN